MASNAGYGIGTTLSAIGLALSVTELQAIFSLIATALGIILIVVNLIFTLVEKYKRAKADGKITADEVEDMKDDVQDAINEINNKIEKK